MLGYGIMAFDAPQLDTWRAAVAGQDGAALDRVLADLQALSLRLDPPELKRVPPPHAADHPRAALLKRKSLVVWNDGLPPDAAYGDRAPGRLHVALQAFSPLHDWLASVSF